MASVLKLLKQQDHHSRDVLPIAPILHKLPDMKQWYRPTLLFRVGVSVCLVATLLLPQGLVYCQSADEHAAIELAHNSCPEASHAEEIEGTSRQGLYNSEEACIDISFMFPAIISRLELGESVSLLASPAKIVSFPAYATDCSSNLHWTYRIAPSSSASPTGVLRTTVLLI